MGRTSPSVFQGFETPTTTHVYICGFIRRCQDIKMQILLNTSSLDVLLQHHVSRSSILIGSRKGIVILQHPVVDVGCDVTFLDSSNYKKKPTTHHLHRAGFIFLPLHFKLVMTFAQWNISRTKHIGCCFREVPRSLTLP